MMPELAVAALWAISLSEAGYFSGALPVGERGKSEWRSNGGAYVWLFGSGRSLSPRSAYRQTVQIHLNARAAKMYTDFQ